jgi:hypothetical protein
MTICLDGLQISSWRPIRSCVPSPHSCIPCWKASTCAASGPVIGDLLLKYLPQASWPIGPFPSLISWLTLSALFYFAQKPPCAVPSAEKNKKFTLVQNE